MICLDFKPVRKNSLLGFATIQMTSGLILKECTYHSLAGKSWASPPGKPQTDGSGSPMKDEKGKAKYVNIVDFASKDVRDKWSGQAVAAVELFLTENAHA
jgi:hypothetical protein